MNGRNALLSLALAAAIPTPAARPMPLCDAPTTSRTEDTGKGEVRLEVETSLNFDRLILLGPGNGSAVLRPDGSSRARGTVAEISPRAMVGTVTVHGEAGRTIRIDLPRRIVLHSLSGGEVTLRRCRQRLPSLPRLDAGGNLTFRFGGRLRVSGDAEGDYRGDLPITAEYL